VSLVGFLSSKKRYGPRKKDNRNEQKRERRRRRGRGKKETKTVLAF